MTSMVPLVWSVIHRSLIAVWRHSTMSFIGWMYQRGSHGCRGLPLYLVPRCRLNTYGRRAFLIAGPTVWNSLPDELGDPACGSDSFKQSLKTILFSLYTNVTSALEVFLNVMRYIYPRLLTYLQSNNTITHRPTHYRMKVRPCTHYGIYTITRKFSKADKPSR